jgi:hypothetical protein
MTVVAIGLADELRGFELAGVRTLRCEAAPVPADLIARVRGLGGSHLLLICPGALHAVPRLRDVLPRWPGGPLVLQLPACTVEAADA